MTERRFRDMRHRHAVDWLKAGQRDGGAAMNAPFTTLDPDSAGLRPHHLRPLNPPRPGGMRKFEINPMKF